MNRHERTSLNGQMPLFVPGSSWTPPAQLPSLAGVKRIGFDLETRDPDLDAKGIGVRRDGKIVGLAVGVDDGPRFYLPVGHEGPGNLDRAKVMAWARAELNAFTGEVVGAYLGYDLDYIAEWGVTFPNVTAFHDVAVAEALIDEWRDSYSLDAIALAHVGEGKDETLLREASVAFGFGKDPKAVKRNLWRLPANLVGPYAEADVDRPLRTFPVQEKIMRAEETWELYDKVERHLVPLLVRMRRRGVRIDVTAAAKLRAVLSGKLSEIIRHLKLLAGPAAELTLPDTLGPALRARGLDVPLTAKTNVDSVTKPWLERNAGDELVDVIAEGRKIRTLIDTFIDSQILGSTIKGRIHPTFNQIKGEDGGTIARFSGSHPNMQFIPARDGELAPLIRGLFLPDEGDEWQQDDLSQIQFRMLTDCAVGKGAEESRAQYVADPKTDFHKMTAEMLGADPEDKVRRKRVKNTNFAKVFGAQTAKLAQTFGCSIEEAEEFMRVYEAKLPFVSATFDAASRWGQKRGFVTTVLGRRQRFPFWGPARYHDERPDRLFRSEAEARDHYVVGNVPYRGYPVRRVERVNTYTALNRKMQGSEGDLMKKWMVDADAAGVLAVIGPFLATVHDELGSSVPKTKVGDEAGQELVRLGEVAVKLKVPVLVGSARGADWGHCSDY